MTLKEVQVHTLVSSVQEFGQYNTWPSSVAYVGMPGRPATAFGIPEGQSIFGKPWEHTRDPRGWPTAYWQYLVARVLEEPEFAAAVKALHGKTLLCWCTAKQAPSCHANLLAGMVEMLNHRGNDFGRGVARS